MKLTIDTPKIPEEEKSELVVLLLEIIRQQGEIIQELKDEIAKLKGHNPKPTIKLRLLRAGRMDYVINSDAVTYWESHKQSQAVIEILVGDEPRVIADDPQWDRYLEQKGIKAARHIQIATESALFAGIIEHGILRTLMIDSDDAGQFNVLLHVLCRMHAERGINKITPVSEKGKEDLEESATRHMLAYPVLPQRYTLLRCLLRRTKTVTRSSSILQITRQSPTRYFQNSPNLDPCNAWPILRGSSSLATRSNKNLRMRRAICGSSISSSRSAAGSNSTSHTITFHHIAKWDSLCSAF